jgi:hypothetical protein
VCASIWGHRHSWIGRRCYGARGREGEREGEGGREGGREREREGGREGGRENERERQGERVTRGDDKA